jgi:predicted DNA-binding transcriptional regulator AlpA
MSANNLMASHPARSGLEPLLTVEDLEGLLRVHRRTIARLCQRGELPPPIKIGGSNRWRAEEIQRVLTGGNDEVYARARCVGELVSEGN